MDLAGEGFPDELHWTTHAYRLLDRDEIQSSETLFFLTVRFQEDVTRSCAVYCHHGT
jgi:hypothetical protein